MYYKKKKGNAFLLVFVITLMVAIVGTVGFFVIKSFIQNDHQDNGRVIDTEKRIEPVLKLELEPIKENDVIKSVKIIAIAETEDESGIKSIVDPKGEEHEGDKYEMTVTENGVYDFLAKGNNGTSKEEIIEVKEIKEASSLEPYMPEGFKHVEGDVNDGYVIEDEKGNQFVWIPVENGRLDSVKSTNTKFTDEGAGMLNNSVAKNKGFYVSRYEIARESDLSTVPVSQENKMPWTQISYNDANQIATAMADTNGYQNILTSLPTGAAWQTIVNWIEKVESGYSSSLQYGNYAGSILPTGKKTSDMVRNISDIAGNVKEWTTERNLSSEEVQLADGTKRDRVLRGGAANLMQVTPEYRTQATDTATDPYWGFRVILYSNASG